MRIGIDLGGTKIEGVVLDDAGAIRFRERRATPRGDYDGTLDALVDLVAAAEAAIGRPAPSASACRAPSRRLPAW